MITMRQLEVFRAVIDHGTVTEAARLLRLSQPAVSKIIASMEHEARLQLFRRERRRLVPTAEGLVLYEHARTVFAGLREINRLSTELRNLRAGRLIAVTTLAFSKDLLPRTMASFLRENAGTSASVHVHSSRTVIEWVVAQQADFGLSMLPTDNPAALTLPFCKVAAVCALPPDHRLCEREAIRPEDLQGERFISFTQDTQKRQEIDNLFARRGVERELVVDSYLSELSCALVAGGVGVSIVDPFTAETFARQGAIALRPFEGPILYAFRLLLPRNRPRSLLADAFLQHLERERDRLMAEKGIAQLE